VGIAASSMEAIISYGISSPVEMISPARGLDPSKSTPERYGVQFLSHIVGEFS
jgi:hypothetical protein